MKKLRLTQLALCAAVWGVAGAANAATIRIEAGTLPSATAPATGGATTPPVLAVNFITDRDADGAAEAGETVGTQFRIAYNTTVFDVTASAQNSSNCVNDDATGQILIIQNETTSDAMGTQNLCNLTFTVAAGQTVGATFPIDLTTAGVGDGCFDLNLNATTCTVTDGRIDIVAGATAPTLTFTPPAPGPITLTGGVGSISVAAGAGSAGTSTALVCTPSAGFTATVTGSPFSPNGTGSVALGCTQTAADVAGTVSCDPTQSAGADQAAQVFNVTCPLLPPSQAPTITFAPPAPGPLTISAAGAGTIGLTASTGTAGSSTTVACTSTNGTATVTGSPFGAAGGTGSVAVQCVPAVGAAGVAFTVTCDPNQSVGTNQAPQVFNATCPAITPQPEFDGNTSVALVGAPGNTATGSTTISNTGNAPLTLACGAATGSFTVTGPPASIAAGTSAALNVSCTTSAAAGATFTGGLVCTTNDTTGGEGTVTFAFSCTSQVLSVPALGNTAKGMLIALLAGLGLFGFAMRRRIV